MRRASRSAAARAGSVPTDAGGVDAVESGNGTGPVTLFRTESSLKGKVGVELRAGVKVAGPLRVETVVRLPCRGTCGGGDIGPRRCRADHGDRNAATFPGREAASCFSPIVGGPGRTRFFVSGGAGYLRQLHQEQTLVETGWIVVRRRRAASAADRETPARRDDWTAPRGADRDAGAGGGARRPGPQRSGRRGLPLCPLLKSAPSAVRATPSLCRPPGDSSQCGTIPSFKGQHAHVDCE